MTHPLEPLLALQKKDLKLIRILREIHDIPKRRDNIESQLSGTKKKLETAVEVENTLSLLYMIMKMKLSY